MKYDVFISYSSHDQEVVKRLCNYLEQHNIRCFVSYRDIPRGVVWASVIVEAMEQSRMMVVVFSEAFNNSQQVDREIEMASESHKPILTLRLSDAPFRAAKKYYLSNINWLDGFPEPESAFEDVVTNIAHLLNLKLGEIHPPQTRTPEVHEELPQNENVEVKPVKPAKRDVVVEDKQNVSLESSQQGEKKKGGAKMLYAALLGVVVVGAALFLMLRGSNEPVEPVEPVVEPEVAYVDEELLNAKEEVKAEEVKTPVSAKERVAANVKPIVNEVAEVKEVATVESVSTNEVVATPAEEPVMEATVAQAEEPKSVAEEVAEVVVATRYSIGDYYDDGNIRGVVFEVSDDGLHGKIVSLEQGNCCWGDVVENIGASNKNDGQPNTNNMLEHAKSEEFAAALWCRNRGAEWYLPSVSELKTLLLSSNVRKAVNKTLGERGAKKVFKPGEPKSYWSSTEVDNDGHKAWEVSLYMKDASSTPKVMNNYVRAVARF